MLVVVGCWLGVGLYWSEVCQYLLALYTTGTVVVPVTTTTTTATNTTGIMKQKCVTWYYEMIIQELYISLNLKCYEMRKQEYTMSFKDEYSNCMNKGKRCVFMFDILSKYDLTDP